LPGLDQGEIEVLPGVAEDFGDEAPVTVAVALPDADLLRDDPAQIICGCPVPTGVARSRGRRCTDGRLDVARGPNDGDDF
jgi:hypothetical protein